jgi:hypothetical protein
MRRRRFWKVDKSLEVVEYNMYDMLDGQSECPDWITNQHAKVKPGYICCYKTPSGRATLMLSCYSSQISSRPASSPPWSGGI